MIHIKHLLLTIVLTTASLLFIFNEYKSGIPLVHLCWDEDLSVQFHSYGIRNKISNAPTSYEEVPIDFVATVPTKFIIENELFCKERPNLKVLAYVHTAITNTQKRNITRSTWANVSSEVGTLFFVGRAKNIIEAKIVESESKMYGDIVQGDYTDAYILLIYKALNALYWIRKNCVSVPWVFHADDDILLDVKYLLNVIEGLELYERRSEIFCVLKFLRSETQRGGKWKVNKAEYPCKYYPPYCNGGCWFTSSSVIKKLLDSVSKTKLVWIDDAYLTGLVAETANITRSTIPAPEIKSESKLEENRLNCVLAWPYLGNREREWPQILDTNKNCFNNYSNKLISE